jgi:hypothetical protein
MNSFYRLARYAFPLIATLLVLSLLSSCNSETDDTTNRAGSTNRADSSGSTNAKEELQGALKGANVTGFDFELREDDSQVTSSFTNSNVKNVIRLDDGTTSVVLKYSSVKDKSKNTTAIYKTEASRSDNAVALLVTDFATGNVVSKDTFPRPAPHNPSGPTFDTLEDCIKDFDCKHKGELQCEANRTCQDQFAAITCCLKSGQCFSVHMVIRPTRPLCKLRDLIPNFEGFVLSSR